MGIVKNVMAIRKEKKTFERAGSTIEYMALIVFLLGALLFFQRHILRGFWGYWKKTGDTYGHGKQFDPRTFGVNGLEGGTLQCLFVYDDPDDPNPNPSQLTGVWVTQPGFDQCRLSGRSVQACREDWKDTEQDCGE